VYVDVKCMLDVVNIDTVMQENVQTHLTIKNKKNKVITVSCELLQVPQG